jgi:hypothetical protein
MAIGSGKTSGNDTKGVNLTIYGVLEQGERLTALPAYNLRMHRLVSSSRRCRVAGKFYNSRWKDLHGWSIESSLRWRQGSISARTTYDEKSV